MATVLDVGLLAKFDLIFPFLLVIIVIYGIMATTGFLGDHKGLHMLIALVLGIIVLLSRSATNTINDFAPWVTLLVVFGAFLFLLMRSMGVEESVIKEFINGPTMFVILILGVVIFVVALINNTMWDRSSDSLLEEGVDLDTAQIEAGGSEGFFATITNAKFLGLVVILLIGMFTVANLTRPAKPLNPFGGGGHH